MLPKYKRLNRQEAIAAWLEQLRAPESLKAKGHLEDILNPNRRCCLGHACHALEMERGSEIPGSYGTEVSFLPKEICKLLGISRMGEFRKPLHFQESGLVDSLAELNDCTSLGPNHIAEVIEEEFSKDNFRPFQEGYIET